MPWRAKRGGCGTAGAVEDSLDNTVIGEGACWQLLCRQDLDEGSRRLPDLLYDAPSPAAVARDTDEQLNVSTAMEESCFASWRGQWPDCPCMLSVSRHHWRSLT